MVTLPRTATYEALADWDRDGVPGDDLLPRLMTPPGVVVQRGRDQVRAFSPPMVPVLSGELLNHDRLYSNEAPGPLHGLVTRGAALRMTAGWGSEDVLANATNVTANEELVPANGIASLPLFVGAVDRATNSPEWGRRAVVLEGLGNLRRLRDQRVTTQLYENITTGAALGHILDAIGWPSGERVIDAGQTTLLYWWLDDVEAWSAAQHLLRSEGAGAALYEDGQGRIHFEGRDYRDGEGRSANVQATYSDVVSASGVYHVQPVVYQSNPDEIVNVARATVRRRTLGALGVVWSLGEAVNLSANETRVVIAVGSDPFKDAVAPASGTDYTVSAGSATVTAAILSGQRAAITVTAGAGGATVTGLQLRAKPLTVAYETAVVSAADSSASQIRYGKRMIDLDLWPEIDVNAARALCDGWVLRYKDERPQLTITLVNADARHMREIVVREVSDRVHVTERHTGVDWDAWVERIEHRVLGRTLHQVVLGCEQVFALDYGRYDSAQYGISRYGD